MERFLHRLQRLDSRVLLWSVRLSVIDESSFLSVCHSDISYDRTDDDVVRPQLERARSAFVLNLVRQRGGAYPSYLGARGGATLDELLAY